MRNNYINLTKAELSKPIYRIMPVHRLFESFENNNLTLVEPEKWDDPFENLLLKGLIDPLSLNAKISKITRNSIYGQCWTLHRETDAMWRIYSPDKQGVKVRTTMYKLLDSLLASSGTNQKSSCYIGKVNYLSQKELVNKLTGISGMYGEDAAKSLLYKRTEFKHEREVRLIYTMNSTTGNIHNFNIDPNDIFDEVVFDPRMNDHIYQAYNEAIKSKGYKKSVRKSVMYQLPKELKECI